MAKSSHGSLKVTEGMFLLHLQGLTFEVLSQEAGAKEALKYNEEAIGDRKLKVEKCIADTKKENNSGPKAQRQPKAPAPKVRKPKVLQPSMTSNHEQCSRRFEWMK